MPIETRLRSDACTIWQAGVDAVNSDKLIRNNVQVIGDVLSVAGSEFSIPELNRIVVVGMGKAGAGMAAAFEAALGEELVDRLLSGWVNVPADCVRSLRRIHLHAARPAGVNAPTPAGVAGANKIVDIVSQLKPEDLCVVLISGGGSALLPAPVESISLADKQDVTEFLMTSGATINELNCVRTKISRIKGGRLAAAASGARALIALIISDVVNDPLEIIASGPTVPNASTADEALSILKKYSDDLVDIPNAVVEHLQSDLNHPCTTATPIAISNIVIGNNAVALEAAAAKARELGYRVDSLGSDNQGIAVEVGHELAERAQRIRDSDSQSTIPTCILSGGEPVVRVVRTDQPRKGGRNQEVVLAAIERLWEDRMPHIAFLSGGTDGEDGPTDAAGALADELISTTAHEMGLIPAEFLAINNSYAFFDRVDGLIKTGPTHTNVMDLRVVLVDSDRD